MLAVVAAIGGAALLHLLPGTPDRPPAIERAWSALTYAFVDRFPEYALFLGTSLLSASLARYRRWFTASLCFLFGVLWLAVHNPLSSYLNQLGSDAFIEANSFDPREALFWFSTVAGQLRPNLGLKTALLYAGLAAGLSWAFLMATRSLPSVARLCTALFVSLALAASASFITFRSSLAGFVANSDAFRTVSGNFTEDPFLVKRAHPGPAILVYIGESTSILNMGAYGYDRATTPCLSRLMKEEPGLLIFHNVFSTHVHTSQSLLEALSISKFPGQEFLPIHQRKRTPLPLSLASESSPIILFSNQGKHGAWNQASTVIFRNIERHFSEDSRTSGTEQALSDLWDDVVFKALIMERFPKSLPSGSVVFYHSYAGHGPYHDFVPLQFRTTASAAPQQQAHMSEAEGAGGWNSSAYEDAMRYVDFNLDQAIHYVGGLETPTVLIYFSDHGDAVFPGLGHDSSRFSHEMARVPFLTYFNKPAIASHPDLFARMKDRAEQRRTASLAQLPSTIMDIGGWEYSADLRARPDILPPVGENVRLPPILVREVNGGVSYIDVGDGNGASRQVPPHASEMHDPWTSEFRAYQGRYLSPRCHGLGSSRYEALMVKVVANCSSEQAGTLLP